MKLKYSIPILITIFILSSCIGKQKKDSFKLIYDDVKVVGAMKNVMWKGELEGSISLDTILDKNGLYGLGPESYLTGEILVNNGKSYVSKVTTDSTMAVEQTFDVSAPFFVYANVYDWEERKLPEHIKTINNLEKYIDSTTSIFKRPFAFKLSGTVKNAAIHIQNLPSGSSVSSPEEAHQGQINYTLHNEAVEIIGFFSTKHAGIFTHHDTFLHMHLITSDETKMGHLDVLEIDQMKLFLPIR
jgi:acetolactate decarboxylase